MFTVPASVTQNIARAKTSLRKGDAIKTVDALIAALTLFNPKKILGKAKYETEILLMECVEELSRHPRVLDFLKKVSPGKEPRIPYMPGQEEQLSSLLPLLLKALKEGAEETEQNIEGSRDDRKSSLWLKGTNLLKAGDAPRGKAVLRRLLEEFGDLPGIFALVGEALYQANLGPDAADLLEKAIELEPGDNKSYAYLAHIYTEIKEFPKAEIVYRKALKRFGQHYKTLLNFAGMYKLWNKRDQAYTIAMMALKEAPDNPEAQELVKWADRS
jgi:tetratricopeptide (TPR) repeat protein